MVKDFKDTLLMGKTDFEMRANLTTKEASYRQFWEKNRVYDLALEARKKAPTFMLHDGPPYANGDLHFGHALNKILKDITIRYKNLQGFYTPFILGWDTHGLPIENKMLSVLKMSKDDLNAVELRQKATAYAKEQIANQKAQFALMQLFTNWNNYYETLDRQYETNQLLVFKEMILKGLIYKGLKPIYWSPSSQSALAEAEVEYKNINSPQIIVALSLKQSEDILPSNSALLVMTTTPWTLIANAAVAVGKDIEYSLVKVAEKHFIVASNLIASVANACEWTDFKVIKTFFGKQLTNLQYAHPLTLHKKCPVVLGHHVSESEGTGLVHTAPLFGEDDYLIGQENKLDMIMHVDDKGVFNTQAGDLKDIYYLKANNLIIEKLKENGKLVSYKVINHAYPHDWRTHEPIIYRATPQWFFAISKIKKTILEALKDVRSFPEWGHKRLTKMIENRNDWTISRQRTWGVPIIVFYDQNQKPILNNEEVFDFVINLVKKHGTDIWWSSTADQLLPSKYRHKNWTKETDIMDVWFDSGCSFLIKQLANFEIDLYLEGNDQYRGWFNSSLINSVAYKHKAPFKTLVSHGFVLDSKHQKMSKSLGNVLDPIKTIQTQGADILRLWAASVEYSSDVNVSEQIIAQVSNMYRNLRTKIRFMLANLFDFDVQKDAIDLKDLDALIAEKLQNLKFQVKNSYENFKFNHVVRDINDFIVEISSYYFEVNKDTLYLEKADDDLRRSVQTNIYNIVTFIIKALSPIMPTTCEEAYQALPQKDKKISLFLEIDDFKAQQSDVEQKRWNDFFTLKDQVYKLIEEAKKTKLIHRSNEAWLVLEQKYQIYQDYDLKKLLLVGKVTFGKANIIKLFESIKCLRCWNHFEKDQVTSETICLRCDRVINK